MADWYPNDLCQVRRGKRWVDAEVVSVEHYGLLTSVRVVLEDGQRVRADAANIRPRPAKRGKLPEPSENARKAREHFAATRETITTPDGRYVLSRPKPVPKPTTARSKDYLSHVRTFPCCSCGATEGVVSHHIAGGGMGAKCSDYLTAPLCGVCHQHWHAKAMLPEHWETLEDSVGRPTSKAVMWEAAARCLEEWVVKKGKR